MLIDTLIRKLRSRELKTIYCMLDYMANKHCPKFLRGHDYCL